MIGLHLRNTADGSRVQWGMPKAAVLDAVDAFVREVTCVQGAQSTTAGYGITSDPVRDLPCNSLFAAVGISVKEPWRVPGVDRTGCSSAACAGCALRKMKLSAAGVYVAERIAIYEDAGTVSYDKLDAGGKPGSLERGLAIELPRRAWSPTSAASPAACAWTGRHRMAKRRIPSRTWRGHLRHGAWKVLGVDQTGCSSAACAGHTLRKVEPSATGVNVAERITIARTPALSLTTNLTPAASPEVWSACSPVTCRRAWRPTSAAPPAACAWTGRHRMAG